MVQRCLAVAALLLAGCSPSGPEVGAASAAGSSQAAAEGGVFDHATTAECLDDERCRQSVLQRIDTRMGGLDYGAGFPTDETVERLYEEMDYQRAVLAHQLSDNLVSFWRMHAGARDAIAGSAIGDLVVWENFLDTKGIVLTGNDTTVYGMAYLDLAANGPMVVKVPPSPFLGSILDLWQVPLSGIDAEGGTFVVVTADFEGELDLPPGAVVLRSRTSVAVFFARGLVLEGDMDAAVSAVTDSEIYPLSVADSPPETEVWLASGVAMDTISPMQPMAYWADVSEVMNFLNPGLDQDASLLISLLEPLGVQPGRPFDPDDRQKRILADAAHFGWVMAQAISYAPRFEDITYYPGTQWEWVLELDPGVRDRFWRDLEARTNYYFQATMAQPAMKTKAVGRGSQYVRSARDSNGDWFDLAPQRMRLGRQQTIGTLASGRQARPTGSRVRYTSAEEAEKE